MKTIRNFCNLVAMSLLTMTLLGGCLAPEESGTESPTAESQPQNRAPTISGSPANAVTMGNRYSFTPSASDPDGDTLTFEVSNKPAWADFDSSTGTLSGTPTLSDLGNYANISITVSDGSLSTSLPEFPVEVVQIALGSVTLSWTPPTQNEDGSSFADLVAYRFYYGTESGSYERSIHVDNPGIASYVVENLVPDTYYFVATAVNSSGIESSYSNEAIKEVL